MKAVDVVNSAASLLSQMTADERQKLSAALSNAQATQENRRLLIRPILASAINRQVKWSEVESIIGAGAHS
jgi:hypothetical protein